MVVKRSLILLALALVSVLALISCAAPQMRDFEAKQSDFQNYKSWNKVNEKPITGDLFGVLGEAHAGPAGVREVYINNIGKEVSDKGSGSYPVGTMIVKEAYKDGKLEVLTMMVKRGEGYDPANGNWEYFMSMPDFSGLDKNRGKIGMCIGCHGQTKNTDYVFHNKMTTVK